MLYQRGNVWWYKFRYAGRPFQESAKTTSKEIARRAELKRRRELEEGYHGLKKRQAPQSFKPASDAWLELKKPTLAPKSYLIEKTNLSHILPVLGQKLLTDIDASDISRYQHKRLNDKAAPKTGLSRSLLKFSGGSVVTRAPFRVRRPFSEIATHTMPQERRTPRGAGCTVPRHATSPMLSRLTRPSC